MTQKAINMAVNATSRPVKMVVLNKLYPSKVTKPTRSIGANTSLARIRRNNNPYHALRRIAPINPESANTVTYNEW